MLCLQASCNVEDFPDTQEFLQLLKPLAQQCQPANQKAADSSASATARDHSAASLASQDSVEALKHSEHLAGHHRSASAAAALGDGSEDMFDWQV